MADATPTLTTARLRLEPVAMEHAPALQRHFADWEVIRHLSSTVPWPYPEDGVERFFMDHLLPRVEAGLVMAWALVLRQIDEPIGLLEWRCAPEASDNRGFWLSAAHRGQGLMTEAVTAFQDYIFFELGVERIFVLNALANEASRRIKQKTGAVFVENTTLDHHSGETATQRWVVTREAWQALRSSARAT